MTPASRFTNDDFCDLVTLMYRYCTEALDQFVHWRLTLPFGEAFIGIYLGPAPGADREAYRSLDGCVRGANDK